MALIKGTNAGQILTKERSSGTKGSFFKDDVDTYFISAPKEGHTLDVIILPSFDYTKGSSEFKTSYVPYRELNSDLEDPITKTAAFTDWAKSCKGYSYFGNDKMNFVSPLTGKAYNARKSKKDGKIRYYPPYNTDPIVDIRNYIFFNQEKVDPRSLKLIQKDEKGIARLPSGPKTYILSNALVSVDNGDWQFKVIAYTETAYIDLIKTLSISTPKNAYGVTPAFDEYYFGDITDPVTGTILSVTKKSSGIGPDFAGFNLSPTNVKVDGRRPVPQGLITPDILSKRVVLNDTDYLDVWSYQRIVDMLIKDQMIPFTTIRDGVRTGTIVEPTYDDDSGLDTDVQPVEDTKPEVETNLGFLGNKVEEAPKQQMPPIPQPTPEVKPDPSSDPEYKVYIDVAKRVMSGSASADEIMQFMNLQTKFGPISEQAGL